LAIGNWKLAIVMIAGGAVAFKHVVAQGNSSLSESKKESAGTEVTAGALLSQNEELRRQLSLQQESVRTLTDSLAQSNAEAELFRRKFSDLQLRMEALGLASADKDRAKLEQRLLNAVSDLQLSQKEREQYRDQMLRLTEAVMRFLKTAEGSDPQARMGLEAQLRGINELIAKSDNDTREAQPSLMDGSVISVKEEWSLVVGNIGEQQGVKMGMPLRVMRNDKVIATLRVVDVRQKICGAVIQEMDSKKEQIKVGDRLQVDARQSVTLK
jgi:chromosome segregation ATPase